ncbi:hypothetical protein GYA28_04380 [Candidatus Roizmanbacteria bacterium]|nr:hypothetical protein [Candidatus Roizmanbacteria bacterium]
MNQKELFLLSVMIFMTILAWMLLDVYRIKMTESTANPTFTNIKNIKLDGKVLEVLKEKSP